MNIRKMILREMLERKYRLFSTVFGIMAGIAGVVGINSVVQGTGRALSAELEKLGFNLLLLPKSSSVQSYYSADQQDGYLPESYVQRLAHSGLHGMNLLSPKLSGKIRLRGREYILTGVFPADGLQQKAAATPFFDADPAGGQAAPPQVKTPDRLIHTLRPEQLIAGHRAAARLGLRQGGQIQIRGHRLTVRKIAAETGTVDDDRLFVHLKLAQKLLNKPDLLSVIEIVGCCDRIRTGLIPHLDRLVPQARIVTIRQIVDTQLKTNRLISSVADILLLVVLLTAGAGIANTTAANVHERRREIGILMALGMKRRAVLFLFLGKALLSGFAGGLGGYICGTAAAMMLAPAGVPVAPDPAQLLPAVGAAVAAAFFAGIIPAARAAALDPSQAFREG